MGGYDLELKGIGKLGNIPIIGIDGGLPLSSSYCDDLPVEFEFGASRLKAGAQIAG